MAANNKYRTALVRLVEGSLRSNEKVVAVLPFVSSLKRPKVPGAPRGKAGKVRVGIYQSWRRYRPMVLTNRRLFVFETGRTPNAREVLAAFDVADIELTSIGDGRFGATRFVLDLPGVGRVPFEAGRRDHADLALLIDAVGGAPEAT